VTELASRDPSRTKLRDDTCEHVHCHRPCAAMLDRHKLGTVLQRSRATRWRMLQSSRRSFVRSVAWLPTLLVPGVAQATLLRGLNLRDRTARLESAQCQRLSLRFPRWHHRIRPDHPQRRRHPHRPRRSESRSTCNCVGVRFPTDQLATSKHNRLRFSVDPGQLLGRCYRWPLRTLPRTARARRVRSSSRHRFPRNAWPARSQRPARRWWLGTSQSAPSQRRT